MWIIQDGIAKNNKKQGGKEPGEVHAVSKSWPISSILVPHLCCTLVANSITQLDRTTAPSSTRTFHVLISLACVGSIAWAVITPVLRNCCQGCSDGRSHHKEMDAWCSHLLCTRTGSVFQKNKWLTENEQHIHWDLSCFCSPTNVSPALQNCHWWFTYSFNRNNSCWYMHSQDFFMVFHYLLYYSFYFNSFLFCPLITAVIYYVI